MVSKNLTKSQKAVLLISGVILLLYGLFSIISIFTELEEKLNKTEKELISVQNYELKEKIVYVDRTTTDTVISNLFNQENWQIVANSFDDFSSIQGSRNWYYGYHVDPIKNNLNFKQLPYHLNSGEWTIEPTSMHKSGSKYYIQIRKEDQHPNGFSPFPERAQDILWPSRKWVCPEDGYYLIRSTVFSSENRYKVLNSNDPYVDGYAFYLVVNGEIIQNYAVKEKNYLYAVEKYTKLKKGNSVEFMTSPNQGYRGDSMHIRAIIKKYEPATH